jgi:hypothetical protein
VLVLGDDLGFYDTQIYNPTSPTPNLKSLAEQGVRLDRHCECAATRAAAQSAALRADATTDCKLNRLLACVPPRPADVFRYCSPTRRSMLSGRFPNHITSVQPDGANLCSDFLPLAATLLSEKLTSGAETRPLFCFVETSFYTKSRAFAKTGSGITPETLKSGRICRRLRLALCWQGPSRLRDHGPPAGAKNDTVKAIYTLKMHVFTKTGSGQT